MPHLQGRDGGHDASGAGVAANAAGTSIVARGGTRALLGVVKVATEEDAGSLVSSKSRSDWTSRNEDSIVFVFSMEAMPRRVVPTSPSLAHLVA